MDLGVYIVELLGLQGGVSVPGIGHFAQTRINGHYNEQENKFYPPAHEVSFEPQSKDDDELARYISNKKNISLASSKYFIDKYVISIKQQVASDKADIGGIGYLYTDGSILAFKAGDNIATNDPSFYGFSPVTHQPVEKSAITEDIPPVKEEVPAEEIPVKDEAPAEETSFTEEIPAKSEEPAEEEVKAEEIPQTIMPADPVYVEETQEEQVQEYEPEEKDRRNVWIGLLLVAIIALLALLGLYKYKPAWFDREEKPQSFVPTGADTIKTESGDTTKKADSAVTAATPANNAPVDTIGTLHYEILGGAFKTLSQANAVMKNYEKLGLQPRIITHTKKNSYIITLGTYFDKEQGQKAIDSIANNTKLRKGPDILLQTYNPKKK